jgi:hypothetical protein
MKIALVFCVLALLCNSCKYIKNTFSKNVDTLVADTTPVSNVIDSAMLYSQTRSIGQEQNRASVASSTGSYYMIVGCFTVPNNAEKYAEMLRGKGFEVIIIPGRDNFQMVSAQSYSTYRSSVNDLNKFRNNVTPNAWVYKSR